MEAKESKVLRFLIKPVNSIYEPIVTIDKVDSKID